MGITVIREEYDPHMSDEWNECPPWTARVRCDHKGCNGKLIMHFSEEFRIGNMITNEPEPLGRVCCQGYDWRVHTEVRSADLTVYFFECPRCRANKISERRH